MLLRCVLMMPLPRMLRLIDSAFMLWPPPFRLNMNMSTCAMLRADAAGLRVAADALLRAMPGLPRCAAAA